MTESYQLTQHPIGSKREFWAMTWPLMIGLLSSTLMMFVDRLFLARWDPLALNAAVTAGLAYFLFLVIPMGVVEIAEVLTGRLHGEERNDEIGSAAWQMVLLSIVLIPIYLLCIMFIPPLMFGGTGNEEFETTYFSYLMIFAPLQCMAIGLGGFFIGVGNVKIVTFSALLSNFANILLDYWLIFGGGIMPELGIAGAAIATGIAQLLQVIFLLSIYWQKHNRQTFGTGKLGLNLPFLIEGLRIGVPSGAGRSIEIVAHFIFFRMVMLLGVEQMTLVAIAQSVYILSSFIIDAQCKSASAIVSNLLGANRHAPLSKVLQSGFTLHLLYFGLMLAIVMFFPCEIYHLFVAGEKALPLTPELLNVFKRVLICVCFFFLFDGLGWILVGFLTAAKDTRFVFWISILTNWVAYVPPTIWFIGWQKGGADVAWMIVLAATILNFLLYVWRYASGAWLKYDMSRQVL